MLLKIFLRSSFCLSIWTLVFYLSLSLLITILLLLRSFLHSRMVVIERDFCVSTIEMLQASSMIIESIILYLMVSIHLLNVIWSYFEAATWNSLTSRSLFHINSLCCISVELSFQLRYRLYSFWFICYSIRLLMQGGGSLCYNFTCKCTAGSWKNALVLFYFAC